MLLKYIFDLLLCGYVQLIGEREVKGVVKLKFHDIIGCAVVCSRMLQSTQKVYTVACTEVTKDTKEESKRYLWGHNIMDQSLQQSYKITHAKVIWYGVP